MMWRCRKVGMKFSSSLNFKPESKDVDYDFVFKEKS
jgi:hypothetical protein